MSFMKFLLLLAIAGALFHFKNEHDAKSALETATVSPNGFIDLPAPESLDSNTVIIFAPANCPKESGQRADNLADELSRHNIPITRSSSANFSGLDKEDPAVMSQLNSVMTGELPIVFVNGKGKANPTLDEVLSEFDSPTQ